MVPGYVKHDGFSLNLLLEKVDSHLKLSIPSLDGVKVREKGGLYDLYGFKKKELWCAWGL